MDSFVYHKTMTQPLLTATLITAGALAASATASRIGYTPFVVATSIFGAILVCFCVRFLTTLPWYGYAVVGATGGLLGLVFGMYGSSFVMTLPTRFISNFEYQRIYARHTIYLIALLTTATVGGGVIGLWIRAYPLKVDEPSDPPKSPVVRDLES